MRADCTNDLIAINGDGKGVGVIEKLKKFKFMNSASVNCQTFTGLSHIGPGIVSDFKHISAERTAWRVSEPKVKIRTGSLFKLENLHSGESFALKTFENAKRAQAQFQLLDESRQRMGGGDFTVPKPYEVVENRSSLLFDWVPYKTLNSLLWRNNFRPSRRLVLVEAAGRWLKTFHNAWGRQPQPLNLELELSRVRAPLRKQCDVSITLLGDPVYARAHRALERYLASATDAVSIPTSIQHGDFTPANIMMSDTGNKVYGIDLTTSKTVALAITRDIGRFLTYLASRRLEPARFGVGSRYAREARAFLAAYDSNLDIEPRLFAFLHLCEVLRRWASRQGMAISAGKNLVRDYERRRLRAFAVYLTPALEI